MVEIRDELETRCKELEEQGKLLESHRLRQRTQFDMEMLRELGFCNGIENYSRILDGREPGARPYCLLDFFPDDFVCFIDESHQTVPQIGGMYEGDRSRKQTLVDYGFRLPSALDNRPQTFDEFLQRTRQIVFVSATPGDFEKNHSSRVVEQIVRPTGVVDPEVDVRETKNQIDDLMEEIRKRVEVEERTLVTTLTKKMAEDLTDYLLEYGFKVRYLHSEIDTLERIQIIRELRLGEFDVLVGVNLLREGLDLPEVSLVAILDADKEGFLRGETSLIQTIGRAARNVRGTVIMYADKETAAMRIGDRGDRPPPRDPGGLQRGARHHAGHDPEGHLGHQRLPDDGVEGAQLARQAPAARAGGHVGRGDPAHDGRARGGDAGRGRRSALRVRGQAARRDQGAAARAGRGRGQRLNLQAARRFAARMVGMPLAIRRAGCALTSVVALCLLSATPASAAPEAVGAAVKVSAGANGAQRLTYRIGPFNVIPGQNEISNEIIRQKPQVDGWITRIRPDLVYTSGRVPGVDVIHLHHGVWANLARPNATTPGLPELFVAAGEEKTIISFPKGYGYLYRASDTWVLNHMIHNLTPVPTQVYMVYEIDFIPRTSPRARGIRPVTPIWMDVQKGNLYPVFDVQKGSGRGGRYTYPDDEPNAYGGREARNEWVSDRNGVLVATGGHLHPGGLYTDLYVRRRGARIRRAACGSKDSARARRRCRQNAPRGRGSNAHLFRSNAKYYEPAGAVSWDVAMTATRPDWRVKIRKGDTLWTNATYNTKRAAWWESMGIMVAYMAEDGPGENPFRRRVNFPGRPTHGHLPENDNHGGRPTGLPDPRKLPDGASPTGPVDILDFKYTLGDLSLSGQSGLPPVVQRGTP